MSKMKKTRKPGGGRKKLKPEYDAGKNLKEQMDAAVALYGEECSLQSIADALNLNPIKVRKLLITAGVYESEVAEKSSSMTTKREKFAVFCITTRCSILCRRTALLPVPAPDRTVRSFTIPAKQHPTLCLSRMERSSLRLRLS